MEIGALAPDTVKRLGEILAAKRLGALVEARNPIDINPGADDEAHLQITETFLQDPNIDAVVVRARPDRAGHPRARGGASCGPDSTSAIRRAACT